jgi:hypothetical protein
MLLGSQPLPNRQIWACLQGKLVLAAGFLPPVGVADGMLPLTVEKDLVQDLETEGKPCKTHRAMMLGGGQPAQRRLRRCRKLQ